MSAITPVVMRIALVAIMLIVNARVASACYESDAQHGQTRFALHDGEARDTRTGLVWQRCAFGATWRDGACAGDTAPVTLDEAIAKAATLGDGWRTPTGAELESLIDPSCGAPVVDPRVFPDIRPTVEGLAKFWTTTPVGMLDLFYNFDFMTGQADGNSRGIYLAVRFVRGP